MSAAYEGHANHGSRGCAFPPFCAVTRQLATHPPTRYNARNGTRDNMPAGASKKSDDLTPKQEAFALAYVETGNAAEAYRRAYDVRAATQHSSIYVAASRLLDNPKVMLRVEELQAQAAEMCLYTVKDAYTEYEVARKLALQEANPSAAVAAVKGKVALFGLEAPARSKHEHTSPDGSMSPKPAMDWSKAPAEVLEWVISQGDEAKRD